jgi:lipoprotein-anchoring transpeptidase ErfK/SrfK
VVPASLSRVISAPSGVRCGLGSRSVRHDGRVKRALAVLAVLGTLASACGGGSVAPPSDRPSIVVTETPSPAPTGSAAGAPLAVDAVSRTRYLAMWNRPGDGAADFVFDAASPAGHGMAPMLVDARRTVDGQPWVRILLPIRPNGSAAWAHVGDVRLVARDEEIVVDLSQRTLRDYVNGRLRQRFRVGVGTPATPTGVGTFYVWQRVPFSNPNQPYGIFALGLSGFSPVLSDWPGGGRMAIHGTPFVSDRGRAVSHGCVRVYNTDMQHLVDVPFGTPVVIKE